MLAWPVSTRPASCRTNAAEPSIVTVTSYEPPTRFVPIAILCVALLPDSYGPVGTFHYAEALAIPRPFAESLVLFALWALIAGHDWRALFLLIGASFIHPIMALAGWGVFGLVLCREDRRWYGAAVLVCVGIVALAFLGVPVVHRLVTPIDADLKTFAAYRIPYLFPTKWPVQSFGYVVVETATMFIAASFFEKRHRFVLIAAVIVGIGGIVAQIVLGDLASRLLVIQAQLWRTEWLVAALGTATFGIAAVELWKRDARSHIVLALLCLSWLQNGELLVTAITAALALFVHFRMRVTAPISRRFVYAIWAGVTGLVIFLVVNYLASYKELISHIPRDAYSPGKYLWGEPSLAFLMIALVLALHAAGRRAHLAPVEKLAACALLLAAFWLWDSRPGFQRLFDAGRHPPALMALIASRPGEVLWVGGLAENWFLTGRPQWASRQQGSSTIFSRELTVQWRERMQFLVAHGLAERDAVVAFHVPPAQELPRITLAGTHALCARQDAPAWIIAPIWDGATIPPALEPHYWRPDQPNFVISDEKTYFEWHRISAYAVLPCAGT